MALFIKIKAPAPLILYKQNNGHLTLWSHKDSVRDAGEGIFYSDYSSSNAVFW